MPDDPTDPEAPELDSTELSERHTAPGSTTSAEQIGPYRLLQKVGEGGMGEVWLAEQQQPVKRKVALKVIKQGMDTKQVVARFEAERQALAMMDHPAVAKVFDAGTTPRGLPYFVMEYVKGVPITRHCDTHRLSTRERLRLFQQVCGGVQHAHQKAIIHRDLKPTNVLVTEQDGKRQPKIIDFGVAKATAQKLTEKTMFTELGVLIGTPEYMSPEQAELTGEDVDTRTDVYSLGVILYELLVGALPFDPKELRSGGFEGIRKKIREEEPHKPSTRLSTLGKKSIESAEARRVDLPTLQRQLRGDLDWITMRALEKDRSRRYGSPMDLAADIERHLKHEPVLASPPSAVYRMRKFVRRHRVGVLTATAAVLVLIGFAVTMIVQARRVARERDAAEQVVEFLAGTLSSLDPHGLGSSLWEDLRTRVAEARRGRGASEDEIEAALAALSEALSGVNSTDTALRLVDDQLLSRTGHDIDERLVDQPAIAGRLHHTLAEIYMSLGLYEPAERHAMRAVETRQHALGAEHAETLRSMHLLAVAYHRQGRYHEAEKLHLKTLEIQKRVLGQDHSDTLESMSRLAVAYWYGSNFSAAESLLVKTLEIQKRVLGTDHPNTLSSMNVLALVHWHEGHDAEAEKLHLETLETKKRVLGNDHRSTLITMFNLALLYRHQGRYAEAEPLFVEVVESSKRTLGDDHPNTLQYSGGLATLYARQGRHKEAESMHLQILEKRQRTLGNDHPDTFGSMEALGEMYVTMGRPEEAEPLLAETVAGYTRAYSRESFATGAAIRLYGLCLMALERYDEAEANLLEAYEILPPSKGPRSAGQVIPNLIDLYEAWNKPDKAAEWRAKLPSEE